MRRGGAPISPSNLQSRLASHRSNTSRLIVLGKPMTQKAFFLYPPFKKKVKPLRVFDILVRKQKGKKFQVTFQRGEMPRNSGDGLAVRGWRALCELPRKRAGESPQHSVIPCQKMPPRRMKARQKGYLGIIWVEFPLGVCQAGQ